MVGQCKFHIDIKVGHLKNFWIAKGWLRHPGYIYGLYMIVFCGASHDICVLLTLSIYFAGLYFWYETKKGVDPNLRWITTEEKW